VHPCTLCDKTFEQASGLKQHMANKHDVDVIWHPCTHPGCDKTFKQPGNLKVHMANKHDVGVIWRPCTHPGCNDKFKEAGNLKKHMAAKHNVDVIWYPCTHPGCNDKFKRASHLNTHMSNKHDVDVIWHPCTHPGCNDKFKQPGTLKVHMSAKHDVDVIWYPCIHPGCNDKFKRAGHLKQHMSDKHDVGVIWHPCTDPECDDKFKQAVNFRAHMASVHDVGEFVCECCVGACGVVIEVVTEHGSMEVCRKCFKKITGCKTRKELRMRQFLLKDPALADVLPWLQRLDRRIGGEACTSYRPDALYAGTDVWIQVECQENQHSGKAYSCEEKRISDIFDETGGKSLVVIMWNPDRSRTHKSSLDERLPPLRDAILRASSSTPQYPIQVWYMYYDRDNNPNICKNLPTEHI